MMFTVAFSRDKKTARINKTNVKKSAKLVAVIWRVGVILINRAFVVKKVNFTLL
jgi:hypothetical protein